MTTALSCGPSAAGTGGDSRIRQRDAQPQGHRLQKTFGSGPAAHQVISVEQGPESLRLTSGGEVRLCLGDRDDIIIGRVEDEERTPELGDMSALFVTLEIGEKGFGDREGTATDLDLGGSPAADLLFRAGDEAADMSR